MILTETDGVLQQGWLSTGDLMTRDEEGDYSVVGRKKELYVSGGENAYPTQVERILQSHPAVAASTVVGVPDPRWGEIGWAFVKIHPGALRANGSCARCASNIWLAFNAQ